MAARTRCILVEGMVDGSKEDAGSSIGQQRQGLTYLIKRFTSFQDNGECAGGTSSPGTIASADSRRYSAYIYSMPC
jgi:hypothetical protein